MFNNSQLIDIKTQKIDIKSDIKPNIKPDIKPDIKPNIKPDIKPDIKPNAKIEPLFSCNSKCHECLDKKCFY